LRVLEKFYELLKKLKEYVSIISKDIKSLNFNNMKEFLFKRKILILFIFLFFILIGFRVGSYRASRDIVLKNLEVALKENKPQKIYRNIRIEEKKINKKDLEPLTEYYSENTTQVDNIINELKTSGKSGLFLLKEDKRLLGNNYTIEMEPVAIKVNTNFNEAKVYLDDEIIAATKIKRGLIPGKYKIRGELDTLYGKVFEDQEIFLMENQEFNLNFQAININLSSNFDDANVFINDVDINKKVKDIKKYGPLPLNKDIYVHLEREFPWGLIKSEKVAIGTLPDIKINIDMVNDDLIKDIENLSNSFYESVFNSLNSNNYSLIENAEEDTKSKIYDSIRKESLFLKNNYELSELKTEIKSSEFAYENNTYKANIVINLNYSVSKKLIPFIKSNVDEMFLTQMKYVNGKWEITDVQKFNLE
jgi:uncharacterized membrane protein YvbJ